VNQYNITYKIFQTHICDGLGRAIQTLDHMEGEIMWHLYYCKKNIQSMACKMHSMLTPHIHWIVRPKIILPMAQNPTPTMAYLALETAYFFFCIFFFCCGFFCSHCFNIPENLRPATIAILGVTAINNTFWIPSAARIIRRRIRIRWSGLSCISGHGVETLQLDGHTRPHRFTGGSNLQRVNARTHVLV